jgi:WD40 repeat protein
MIMAPDWLKRLFRAAELKISWARHQAPLESLPDVPYPPDLPCCRQVDPHPSGRYFLTVWGDHMAVHDAGAGSKAVDDLCPEAGLLTARFSPDGGRVVLGTRDDRALLVDWSQPTVLGATPELGDYISELRWRPDGRLVGVTQSNEVVELNRGLGAVKRLAVLPQDSYEPGASMALSPDGARVFVATGHEVRCLDSETGAQVWQHKMASRQFSPAVSPAGSRIAVASDRVRLLDAATGVTVAEGPPFRFRGLRFPAMPAEMDGVAFTPRLAFSPGDRYLAATTPTGRLQLLDPATLEILREYLEGTELAWIEDVAWFADGERLLLGCANDRVLVWSVEQEQCLVDARVSTPFAPW